MLQDPSDRLARLPGRKRRGQDGRMGQELQELVDVRPGQAPRIARAPQTIQENYGSRVLRRFLIDGVKKEVGIDERPHGLRSRRSSDSRSATSMRGRPKENVGSFQAGRLSATEEASSPRRKYSLRHS